MKEKLVPIPIGPRGEVGVTLGDNFVYVRVPPVPCTLVGVDITINATDDLTVDVNRVTGPAELIGGIVLATAAAPGSWRSTDMGGTHAPIALNASEILSLDAAAAAANTVIGGFLWVLLGE